MYSPINDLVLVEKIWTSYKDAVKRVKTKEECYYLLECLIEASKEEYVPDDLKQAIKSLVSKMF